jgi:hypothetical protein
MRLLSGACTAAFLCFVASSAHASYQSYGVFCNSMVTNGQSISLPSSGTLCINSGTYNLSSGLTVSNSITITGWPVQNPQINTTSSGSYVPPVFMPKITQTPTGGFTIFDVTANNVTIQGLWADGTGKNIAAGSCGSDVFTIEESGVTGETVVGTVFSNFTCGVEGNRAGVLNASGNVSHDDTYTAFNCSPCTGQTSTWANNLVYNEGTGQTNSNSYPFTASSGGSGTQDQYVTMQYNSVFYNPVWECYDSHDGAHITWDHNLCVGWGESIFASSPRYPTGINYGATGAGYTIHDGIITNNVVDYGTSLYLYNNNGGMLQNSITTCSDSGCTGTTEVATPFTISGNTLLMGSSNGCVMYYTTLVNPTNNNGGTPCGPGGYDPETVSSITLSANTYTAGQPNHTIATINVNMRDTLWQSAGIQSGSSSTANGNFPMPPGVLTLNSSSPSGCAQIVGNQLIQSASGSPVGNPGCTVTITATLPGANMNGAGSSSYTSGSFSLTGN